jgi:hypothetical protein
LDEENVAAWTAKICRKNDEKRRKNRPKTRWKTGGTDCRKTGRRRSELAGIEAGTSGPTGNAGRNRVAVPKTPGNGRKTANTPAKRAGNA